MHGIVWRRASIIIIALVSHCVATFHNKSMSTYSPKGRSYSSHRVYNIFGSDMKLMSFEYANRAYSVWGFEYV